MVAGDVERERLQDLEGGEHSGARVIRSALEVSLASEVRLDVGRRLARVVPPPEPSGGGAGPERLSEIRGRASDGSRVGLYSAARLEEGLRRPTAVSDKVRHGNRHIERYENSMTRP